MALDWLLDPVTADQPCGPDLETTDDPEFLDYYFEAESRLPERYFTPGNPNVLGGTEDRIFDPRSVDLKRETEAITALLRRSRDLRLLSLLARFQILAGRPGDFADTLEAMALLLQHRTEAVHPQIVGSASDRRGALDALSEQATVIMPLVYLQVPANSDVSWRQYMIATGAMQPRAAEADSLPDTGNLLGTIRTQAKAVAVTHDALTRAAHALNRIAATCRGNGAAAFTPVFAATLDAIGDVQRMIAEALPELPIWSSQPDAAALPETPATGNAAENTADQAATAPLAPAVAPAPISETAVHIPDHASATAAIAAAERYLAMQEPSSLSLLLVVQARLLVGKSIIDAIELLMPQDAGRAEVTLGQAAGQGPGFTLDMARLKSLAQSAAPKAPDSTDSIDVAATKPMTIADRNQLAGYLRAVEEFYLRNEPASPIPVLLGGARNMLTKTFHAILGEILPPKPAQG